MSPEETREVSSLMTRRGRLARPVSKRVRRSLARSSSSAMRRMPASSRTALKYPTVVIHGSAANAAVAEFVPHGLCRSHDRSEDP